MKRIGKRIWLIIFLFIVFLMLLVPVVIQQLNKSNYLKRHTKILVPDQSQIAKYDLYKVCVEKINYGNNHSTSVIDTILSLCQYQESRVSNDFVVKVYISNTLKDYIPLCKKIVDISIMNEILYLYYTTTDNHEVWLGYDKNGLRERSVYDIASDKAFIENQEGALIYEYFRHGK